MKEIGRTSNVTKEMTDLIFEKDHKGISVADNAGTKVQVNAFVLYQKDMIKDKSDDLVLKFWDTEGQDWYAGSQIFIKSFMRMIKEHIDLNLNLLPEPMQITITATKSAKGFTYYDIEEAPKAQPSKAWLDMEW